MERSPDQGDDSPGRPKEQVAQPLFEMQEGAAHASASRLSLEGDDDPVWTWNAPLCVTGDTYGAEENKQVQTSLGKESQPTLFSSAQPGLQAESSSKLSIEEKRENAISYFSILAELEERKGGVSHFRLILTFGPEATNRQIKAMVNAFLGENFLLARAMVAIHRDTEHTHAHLHVHVRQLDNKRVNLGQKYFKLDESWMKICSEHLRDSEIYDKHMELKRVTLEWKERTKEARLKGEPIPPKDDRWSDHHETFLRFQPWDDRWCGRLLAQTIVAEKSVEFLTLTKASKKEITAAAREAQWLRERLDAAAEKRHRDARSEAKRRLPAEIITVSEARDLATFERAIVQMSRDIQRENLSAVTAPSLRQSQPPANKQETLLFDEMRAITVDQPASGHDRFKKANGLINSESQSPRSPVFPLISQARMTDVTSASAMPQSSIETMARVLGIELMAEARMSYIEYCTGKTKTRKDLKQLKEQSETALADYKQISAEAEKYRSALEGQGITVPSPELTEDERSYLKFVAKYIAEPLRERIITEVNRGQTVPTSREGITDKRKDETLSRPEATHRIEKKNKQRRLSSEQQLGVDLEVLGNQAEQLNSSPSRQQNMTLAASGKNTPEMSPPILADDDASRLIISKELAEARLATLHAEEAEFKETPHLWLSPSRSVSLRAIEEQLAANKQAKNVEALVAIKEEIQQELAVERITIRERRIKAEVEVKDAQARFSREEVARGSHNLPMPLARWTPEDVLELTGHSESARAPHLLKRGYEIERDFVLRDFPATSDKSGIRLLEGRYVGLELKAEIALDKSEKALARALQHPEKMILPALDRNGRDIAISLEHVQPQKGIKGMLKRVTEKSEALRFRQQLGGTKESYLQYLRTRCEMNRTYYDMARDIADECRARSREHGFDRYAAPDLSREELFKIENYACQETSQRSQYWLFACRQGNLLLDQKSNAVRVTPAVPEPQRQSYTVPEDIQKRRSMLEKQSLNKVEEKIRERKDAPARPELVTLERNKPSKQRGGHSRS